MVGRPPKEHIPRFVEPMLSRGGAPPSSEGWAVEIKWDGVRGQLRIDDEDWCLRSRPGRDCSESFPELQAVERSLRRRRVVLDGELVHLGQDGKPDFVALRRRLTARSPKAVSRAASGAPATFVVFDVLHLDGCAVRYLPYHTRRDLLCDLVEPDTPKWFLSASWVDGITDVLAITEEHGLEGVVCNASSPDTRPADGALRG